MVMRNIMTRMAMEKKERMAKMDKMMKATEAAEVEVPKEWATTDS